MAIEADVKLVIGTDAHNIGGLELMQYGIATAARGWVIKNDVLNTFSLAKIKSFVKAKRPR
jgi:DNA polymerase (family 10)